MNDETAPEIPQRPLLTPQQAWTKVLEFNPISNNEKMRLSAIAEIKYQLENLPKWSISTLIAKRMRLSLLSKWRESANARLQLVHKDKVTAEPFNNIDRLLNDYDIIEIKKEVIISKKDKPHKSADKEIKQVEEKNEVQSTHVPVKLTEGGEVNGMELPAGIIVDVPAEDVDDIIASGKAEEVPHS